MLDFKLLPDEYFCNARINDCNIFLELLDKYDWINYSNIWYMENWTYRDIFNISSLNPTESNHHINDINFYRKRLNDKIIYYKEILRQKEESKFIKEHLWMFI